MVTFESDYNNGAHPTVLRSLIDSNDKKSSSYGSDYWSQEAREKIRLACQCNKAAHRQMLRSLMLCFRLMVLSLL